MIRLWLACGLLGYASIATAQQCVTAPPTLDWQTAQGAPLGYPAPFDEQVNALITSHDVNCPPTTYTVTAEPYDVAKMPGWTFYTKPDGGVPAPLAGPAVAAVHIVSPAGAQPGTYTVKVTVVPQNAPANVVVAYLGSVVIPTGSICTFAPPVVTLTPALMTDLAPGQLLTFTVGITNRNSPACVLNAFDLGLSTSPASLPSVFLGGNNTVSVGATGNVTLQVALPADAAGSYALTVTATQRDAPMNVGRGTATATIKDRAVLDVNVTAANAKRGASARVTTTVLAGGKPAASAQVIVAVTAPNGQSSQLPPVLTDANGKAAVLYPVAKKAAVGSYQVLVSVTKAGLAPSSGQAMFTVQ